MWQRCDAGGGRNPAVWCRVSMCARRRLRRRHVLLEPRRVQRCVCVSWALCVWGWFFWCGENVEARARCDVRIWEPPVTRWLLVEPLHTVVIILRSHRWRWLSYPRVQTKPATTTMRLRGWMSVSPSRVSPSPTSSGWALPRCCLVLRLQRSFEPSRTLCRCLAAARHRSGWWMRHRSGRCGP